MATEDEEKSPFTRPGFIVSAAVVGAIVVIGVIVGVNIALKPTPTPSPSASEPSTSATPTPAEGVEGGASVCGLEGVVTDDAEITTMPQAEWKYEGAIAYPVNPEFGPAETAAEGYRYCFQRSPEGAVFASANATVQGSSPAIAGAWIDYFLSTKAPNRAELLEGVSAGGSGSSRVTIVGFRVLAYDGTTARIDIATQVMAQGKTVYGSAIYALVWEDGDWKLLPDDPATPLPFAVIPNASSYIPWSG